MDDALAADEAAIQKQIQDIEGQIAAISLELGDKTVDKEDGVSIEVPTPSTVPGDTSEATSDASEPTSGSARPKDFEYENAVDDGYYFVGDGPQDDEVAVHDLSVQLALALGGDLKMKEESLDTDQGPVADTLDGECNPAPDSKPSKSRLTRRELLRNAAKARIRRMVANKKKRSDLQCPPWLKAEWEKGTEQKENMTACLQAVNWDKAKFIDEMERVVTSRKKIIVKKEEGWYSEAEMKSDLCWQQSRVTGAKAYCTDPKRHATHTRTNVYDNIVEYWVTVREHGAYEEEHEILERKKSTRKADEAVEISPGTFGQVQALMDRGALDGADDANKELPDGKVAENKAHFKRFMDSVLTKSTKLKGLVKDLRDNYENDTAKQYISQLEQHVSKLEKEYDVLTETMAKGENSKYDAAWWNLAHEAMKKVTFVSSRATAEEQKVRKSKQFLTKMSSPGPNKPPGGSSTRGNKRPSGNGDSNKKPKKAKKRA